MTQRRQTAGERRETVLAAAISEFGAKGYHGAPTEQIATRAGISHAYLFRLFPTKKDLFLACVARCYDRTTQTFRDAVASKDDDEPAIVAMGHAYIDLLADREILLMQLQTYAAADDPDVRTLARERYDALRDEVRRLGGLTDTEAVTFIAQGMLLNNVAALDLDPEEWIFVDWDEE